MKLKLILSFLILTLSADIYASALKTGSQIRQLPSKTFLDGVDKNLNEFLDDKFVVLYLWEMNQASLQEFYLAANTFTQCKKQAEFIAVGMGEAEKLKRFPGAVRLGFPVNADAKGAAKKLFARNGDTLPLAVILDKNGTILWRGKIQLVPKVLKECSEGKFNLSEQIRVEEFSLAVSNAVKNEELDKALAMIKEEYKRYPGKTDLLNAQISLLKKLDRDKDVPALLHEAQKIRPQDYRIFEIEYRFIGDSGQLDLLPEFFTRLKKNFAEKPNILIAFAIAECKLPPDKLNLEFACDLAAAGWEGQHFNNNIQRGLYALDYASIMHNIGRNDLAVILAEEACKNLAKDPKNLQIAQNALTYYGKLAKIAPAISLPDLKK